MSALHWCGQVMDWAVRTSLDATPILVLALTVSLARIWTPRWRLLLLSVAMVRLLLPVVPQLSFHPAAWLKRPAPAVLVEPAALDTREVEIVSGGAQVVSPPVSVPAFRAGLWLAGAAGVVGWLLLSQGMLVRLLRRFHPIGDATLNSLLRQAAAALGIRRVPRIGYVPGCDLVALSGLRRARLLVPEDLARRFSGPEIRGVFRHELAHLKRRDLVWNWVVLGVCALHWFNPLVWLLLRRWRAEVELRCDEIALRACTPAERQEYGRVLLAMWQSGTARVPAVVSLFFRPKLNLKHRILMIAQPPRVSRLTQASACLVIALLASLTLTTARADGDQKPKRTQLPEAAGGSLIKKAPREGEVARKDPAAAEKPVKKPAPEGDKPVKKPSAEGEKPFKKPEVEAGRLVKKPGAGDEKPVKKSPPDGDKVVKKPSPAGDKPVKKPSAEGDRPVKKPYAGDEKPVKKSPPEGEKPVKKPAPGGDKPVKKPAAEDGKPFKRPSPEADKIVKKPAPDGDKIVKKPSPEGDRPFKKPSAEGDRPVKKPVPDKEAPVKKFPPAEGGSLIKKAPRDGDQPKAGFRDGDKPRVGPRDGEQIKKPGPRDARVGEARDFEKGGTVVIQLDDRGRMTTGKGQVLDQPAMREELRRIARTAESSRIVLRADEGVSLTNLQKLINECQEAGIKDVYLSAGR